MKHVFVLGAGASAASSNTPLGSALVWNYHADCTLLKTYNSKGEPDLTEDNKKFTNYKKFLGLVGRHYPELKDELARYEVRGDSFYHAPKSSDKKYFVDEILRVVQERQDIEGASLIRNLIFEHIVLSSLGYPDLGYKKFKTDILKNKDSSSVSIISFNFDFLLREDFRDEISFDYLLEFGWIEKTRASQYKGRGTIPLIKLNGSLDWGVCQKCDRMHLYFYPRDKEFFNKKLCEKCGGSIQPFIVIPHEKDSEILNVLWNTAESALRQADKITIIGYSFPAYDQKVISLFKRALNRDVEIEVIDHCESNEDQTEKVQTIRNKYKRMFPELMKETRVSVGGFRAYIAEKEIGIVEHG